MYLGLKEQTVRDAKTLAEAHSRHRWRIPNHYNVSVDCLDRHAGNLDRVALFYVDDEGRNEQYSFRQLIQASNRLANALRALGIEKGHVVAVHLPQRPETAILHMAIYRLGAIALPISKLFGPEALKYRLANSEARAIVLETESAGKLEEIRDFRQTLPHLQHVILVGGKGNGLSFDALLAKASDQFEVVNTAAEDPILLMYTSGTTGDPKGVLHASRYLLGHNGIDYSYNFLRETDVYYSPADWAWAVGLLDSLLGIWPYGVPVLAYRSKSKFDPEVTYRLMEKFRISVGIYPSTALKLLREIPSPREKHQLSLRCIASGGEPVSPELVRWVNQDLGADFNQAYGQTEANYFIGNCGALEAPKIEALGKSYPGHEVRILGADGSILKPGEMGEIALRRDNPVVMKEYWRKPEATREKFHGEWLLTGDRGYRDDVGNIYFQGRSDDVIKSSGYRIGPAEVESSIMEVPAVASCAVIGVPDTERGQVVKAFIKLMPGHDPTPAMTKLIQDHVKKKLAAHEYPREIEYIREFPVTVTGKIKRKELREMEEKRRVAISQ